MGIYHCHDTSIYDIETPAQGTVYFIMLLVYLCFEPYYIYVNISLCKNRKEIRKSLSLILFYSLIHVICIRTMLYLAGGTLICYSKPVYEFITSGINSAKEEIILLFIYRISLMLNSFGIMVKWKKFIRNAFIIILICNPLIDIFLYIIKTITDAEFDVEIWFRVAVNIILLVLFIFFIIQLICYIRRYCTNYKESQHIANWYIFLVIMFISTLMHMLDSAMFFMYRDDKSSIYSDITYALFYAIFILTTEIIPFFFMVCMMYKTNTKPSSHDDIDEYYSDFNK